MRPSESLAIATLPLLMLLSACSSAPATAPASRAPGSTASAEMKPTAGQSAAGVVTLRQKGESIELRAQLSGLQPGQVHGFHVHEKGDCSAPDASSAGAHLNPADAPHGMPHTGPHHAGDLPALKADASGRAEVTFEVKGTLLGAGAADFMGKALVVHAQPDDYRSQPAGNSGARIACGVIATPTGRGGDAPKTVPHQM